MVSSYEYAVQKKRKKDIKILVSNSLATRKFWFENFKGSGVLPSQIMSKKPKNGEPVYLLGHEQLNVKVWQKINEVLNKNET